MAFPLLIPFTFYVACEGTSSKHAVALRVMRLFKPKLSMCSDAAFARTVSELHAGCHGFGAVWRPMEASAGCGITGMLRLPESFGTIYLGQIFASYVCVTPSLRLDAGRHLGYRRFVAETSLENSERNGGAGFGDGAGSRGDARLGVHAGMQVDARASAGAALGAGTEKVKGAGTGGRVAWGIGAGAGTGGGDGGADGGGRKIRNGLGRGGDGERCETESWKAAASTSTLVDVGLMDGGTAFPPVAADISVEVELQTPTRSIPLRVRSGHIECGGDDANKDIQEPNDLRYRIDSLGGGDGRGDVLPLALEHLLTEVGVHVLRVAVRYTDLSRPNRDKGSNGPGSGGAGSISKYEGKRRLMRKFYKFNVLSPIHVALKQTLLMQQQRWTVAHGANKGNGALGSVAMPVTAVEVALRNLTQLPLALERVSLDMPQGLEAVPVAKEPSVVFGEEDGRMQCSPAGEITYVKREQGHGESDENKIWDSFRGAPIMKDTAESTALNPAAIGRQLLRPGDVRHILFRVRSRDVQEEGVARGIKEAASVGLKPTSVADRNGTSEGWTYAYTPLEYCNATPDGTEPAAVRKGKELRHSMVVSVPNSLGLVNILWVTSMGETGRLQTAAVRRQLPMPFPAPLTASLAIHTFKGRPLVDREGLALEDKGGLEKGGDRKMCSGRHACVVRVGETIQASLTVSHHIPRENQSGPRAKVGKRRFVATMVVDAAAQLQISALEAAGGTVAVVPGDTVTTSDGATALSTQLSDIDLKDGLENRAPPSFPGGGDGFSLGLATVNGSLLSDSTGIVVVGLSRQQVTKPLAPGESGVTQITLLATRPGLHAVNSIAIE